MSDQSHGDLNAVVQAQFGESEAPTGGESLEAALSAQSSPHTESAEAPTEQVEAQTDSQDPNDEQFSKKFAALSRKEKAVREKETYYEEQMAQLQSRLAELEAPKEEVKADLPPELPLEYRLKSNPIETLESLGLSYDKLTELVLNDGKLSTDMQMKLMKEDLESGYKSKFEELETRLAEKEKAEEESKLNSVVSNFKDEISTHIESNSEAFELIKASNSESYVFDVIEEHYSETGRVLSIQEAAEAVEDHLLTDARKLISLKKLAQTEPPKPSTPTNEQSPITLSNAHAVTAQNPTANKLTNEQSKVKMAELLKWIE